MKKETSKNKALVTALGTLIAMGIVVTTSQVSKAIKKKNNNVKVEAINNINNNYHKQRREQMLEMMENSGKEQNKIQEPQSFHWERMWAVGTRQYANSGMRMNIKVCSGPEYKFCKYVYFEYDTGAKNQVLINRNFLAPNAEKVIGMPTKFTSVGGEQYRVGVYYAKIVLEGTEPETGKKVEFERMVTVEASNNLPKDSQLLPPSIFSPGKMSIEYKGDMVILGYDVTKQQINSEKISPVLDFSGLPTLRTKGHLEYQSVKQEKEKKEKKKDNWDKGYKFDVECPKSHITMQSIEWAKRDGRLDDYELYKECYYRGEQPEN